VVLGVSDEPGRERQERNHEQQQQVESQQTHLHARGELSRPAGRQMGGAGYSGGKQPTTVRSNTGYALAIKAA